MQQEGMTLTLPRFTENEPPATPGARAAREDAEMVTHPPRSPR